MSFNKLAMGLTLSVLAVFPTSLWGMCRYGNYTNKVTPSDQEKAILLSQRQLKFRSSLRPLEVKTGEHLQEKNCEVKGEPSRYSKRQITSSQKQGSGASKTIFRSEIDGKMLATYTFRKYTKQFARLNHEVAVYAKLRGVPGVVNSYGIEELDDEITHFIEFFKDGDLKPYCSSNRLSARQIIDISKQLCLGVVGMHEKNVVHRDLKPSNILVEMGEGNAVRVGIGDFDQAYFFDDPFLQSEDFNHWGTTLIYAHPRYIDSSLSRNKSGESSSREELELESVEDIDQIVFQRDKRHDHWGYGTVVLNLIGQSLTPWQTPPMGEALFVIIALQRSTVSAYIDQMLVKLEESGENVQDSIPALRSVLNCSLDVEMNSSCDFKKLCSEL